MHPREELGVWRVRLSVSVFHDKVIKDRAKVNGYSAAVIPHSYPVQQHHVRAKSGLGNIAST